MDINELRKNALNLGNRFNGINGWIKNNINTAPNFREMIDCIIEYGKLTSKYNEFYSKVGYPYLEKQGRVATHYEIPSISSEVAAARDSLYEMIRLRSNHEFFNDKIAHNLMQELSYRASIGEYNEPKDAAVAMAKKDSLCIAAGVYFYIWETKQREPWYQYDNENEWNDLNNKYALYKESVGIQTEIHGDSIYQGPQFGEVIEPMIKEIEKNYLYREVKDNSLEESVSSHK